jgi:hypothetical protein
MRLDLYYAAYRLLVEYDGRQHADDPGSGIVTSPGGKPWIR